MRLLFVADGRSPIALNWIQYFVHTGHEVHLASTYPCNPELKLATLNIIPVAFSSVADDIRPVAGKLIPSRKDSLLRKLTTPRLRTTLRQWFGPLTLAHAGRRLRALIEIIRPELVHAMRIPYEGMIATRAKSSQVPLILSIWGNDFTLHARSTPLMAQFTRQALTDADALHTDCHRDLRLAREWDFDSKKPTITVPGNGGIDLDVFSRRKTEPSENSFQPKIINPRGFRAYVRNDTFFKAIPLVLEKYPQTRFILPAMAGDPHAIPYQTWLKTRQLDQAVHFLPQIPRLQMAELFREAMIAVSPSEHDGTPNTLLEAMACGCLPIAGDIESVREWITPDENGLLFNPSDAHALAMAIIRGLESADLRERAAKQNARLVADRAEYRTSMAKAEAFYAALQTV